MVKETEEEAGVKFTPEPAGRTGSVVNKTASTRHLK